MKAPEDPKRRKLLAGLTAGGAGAAALLVAGRAAVTAQAGTAAAQEDAGKGYRLTEHVRSYYRTAGI